MSRTIGPKQALFAQLALTASALGSAARLELLDFLAQSERSIDELAKLTGLSVANTSKHLQQLRRAGLVQGLRVIYSVAGDDIIAAVIALRELAESRLAEVDRIVASYLASKDGLEPVSSEAVKSARYLADKIHQSRCRQLPRAQALSTCTINQWPGGVKTMADFRG